MEFIKNEELTDFQRLEKIAGIISEISRASRWRPEWTNAAYGVSFGDVDYAFDPSCPNRKVGINGYKNITLEEWRKALKLLQKKSYANKVVYVKLKNSPLPCWELLKEGQ